MKRKEPTWNWNSRGRLDRDTLGRSLAHEEIRGLERLAEAEAADQPQAMRLKQLLARYDRAQTGAVAALSLVLELKNLKTGRYARQLSGWAMRVAEQMGIYGGELADLEIASLLYDIGKIGVPDEILLKPEALTEEEFSIVRKHPEYGWGILRAIPGFENAALMVLHHHERWDGDGYPAGLAGDQIPRCARIIAVIDALEAMLSDRPYRPGLPASDVIARLRPAAGVQFDPQVVEKFVWIAGWSPPELDALGDTRVRSLSGLTSRDLDRATVRLAAV